MKIRDLVPFVFLISGIGAFAEDRPNIIVFLVDDMGWMDTSIPFGEDAGELNKREASVTRVDQRN